MTSDPLTDPQPRSRALTRWIKVAVGLAVSAICLWLAVRGMLKDPQAWDKVMRSFRRANYASLPVILSVLFVFYWMKAWRWHWLLAPVGRYRPLRDLLGPILIGFGFNNLLPMRIGEFLRCHVFSRQQRVPLAVALSSVVLERILDGMAIVFYLSIGLLFVQGLDPRIQQGAMVFSGISAVIVAAALVYVFWTPMFVACVEGVLKRLRVIPHALTVKICRILEAGAQGLASLKDIRLVLAMLAISLVKWGLNSCLVLLSLWSFDLPHTVPIALVLMGAIAFGVAIPSSPGYIGVMQLVFVSVMQFFTQDQEAVLAASIYYQFTQWIPVTLAGVVYGALFLTRDELRLSTADPGAEEQPAIST